MSRWDATRAKKRSDPTAQPRTCIRCRKSTGDRYLYCSEKCSTESRAQQKGSKKAGA